MGNPTRRFDLTIMFVIAVRCFYPPKLNTSTMGEARRGAHHRWEHTGEEDGDFPLAGHTSVHLVHVNRTLGRSKWTKFFIDQLCGLWTNVGGFTMNRASPVNHHLTPDPPINDQPR